MEKRNRYFWLAALLLTVAVFCRSMIEIDYLKPVKQAVEERYGLTSSLFRTTTQPTTIPTAK